MCLANVDQLNVNVRMLYSVHTITVSLVLCAAVCTESNQPSPPPPPPPHSRAVDIMLESQFLCVSHSTTAPRFASNLRTHSPKQRAIRINIRHARAAAAGSRMSTLFNIRCGHTSHNTRATCVQYAANDDSTTTTQVYAWRTKHMGVGN